MTDKGSTVTKTLQDVYDGFAETYESNRGSFDISSLLDSFYASLSTEEGHLLDLGCGAGEPVARFFIDNGWQVTGCDFSQQMIGLAKKFVPEMKAVHGDMTKLSFEAESFTAISATYSLFHISSKLHFSLFEEIYRWLKPGGKILFTYATQDYTGSLEFDGVKMFLGERLYYSHKSPDALCSDLNEIGFALEQKATHEIGGEKFLWLTAAKPA